MSDQHPAIQINSDDVAYIDGVNTTDAEVRQGTAIRDGKSYFVTLHEFEKYGIKKTYVFLHIGKKSKDDFNTLIDQLNPYSVDGTIF